MILSSPSPSTGASPRGRAILSAARSQAPFEIACSKPPTSPPTHGFRPRPLRSPSLLIPPKSREDFRRSCSRARPIATASTSPDSFRGFPPATRKPPRPPSAATSSTASIRARRTCLRLLRQIHRRADGGVSTGRRPRRAVSRGAGETHSIFHPSTDLSGATWHPPRSPAPPPAGASTRNFGHQSGGHHGGAADRQPRSSPCQACGSRLRCTLTPDVGKFLHVAHTIDPDHAGNPRPSRHGKAGTTSPPTSILPCSGPSPSQPGSPRLTATAPRAHQVVNLEKAANPDSKTSPG